MSTQAHVNSGERPEKLNRSGRKTRVSINGPRDVLNVKGMEEGFHYCVVNDYNVPRYLDAGYEYVTHEVVWGEKRVDRAAYTTSQYHTMPVGNGVTGYLMRCENDIYQEELDEIHRKADEAESITKESFRQKNSATYGEVKIETKRK